MHEKARELVALLSEECGNLEDVQALLKSLFKGTIERMLEAEMDEHLGYHTIIGYTCMIYLIAAKLRLACPNPLR